MKILVIIFIAATAVPEHEAFMQTEEELFQYLFDKGYNKDVRPTNKVKDVTKVTLQLFLSQLIDLDAQRLVMTTSVWVNQTWNDIHLRWKPEDFGNITSIRLPSEFIWLPDVVLMENTDGNFTSKHPTKALIKHDGTVNWNPPAIYRSTCAIDATFFPFDIQNCTMKFASWSYDAREVELGVSEKDPVVIRRMTNNGEWDIIDVHVAISSGLKIHEETEDHSVFSHPKVCFSFILRRLPLFYCVFLVAPCLGISFLTSLVFYLPSASQEKITLCISILLAHIFYLLVITEIMPASSTDLPIIAEYLLLNMIFITLSIILTTVVLNVHYRSNTTHRRLPRYIRLFVLNVAPRLLWMERPDLKTADGVNVRSVSGDQLFRKENFLIGRHLMRELKRRTTIPEELCSELGGAIESAFFIAERIKRQIHQAQMSEEWRFVANVLDRAFFVLFLVVSVLGAVILILPAWADKSYLHIEHRETSTNGPDSRLSYFV